MRILHTSDWHLGKHLEGRDRLPEQIQFINEICEIVEKSDIHMVLIAGDIFDTFVPTAAAEELFYDAVERLSNNGKRAVVIIAGNHDSPERLCAAKPLAKKNSIVLLGIPGDVPMKYESSHVQIVDAGQSWFEVAVEGSSSHAVVISLPYPSEARLKEILTQSLSEEELQRAYSERVSDLLLQMGSNFRQDTVNIIMSHVFVTGAEQSDSERPIQLGGAPAINLDRIPEKTQYIALGHLHRPQRIKAVVRESIFVPAHYSGSPLGYSFSEAGQTKQVVIVDLEPSSIAKIETVELKSGKPLVKLKAKSGFDEALKLCENATEQNAWIDIEIHMQEVLTQEQIRFLRLAAPDIINIRPVITSQIEKSFEEQTRMSKPLQELFADFYKASRGAEPKKELVDYFMEIAMIEPDSEGKIAMIEPNYEVSNGSDSSVMVGGDMDETA